MLENLSNPDDLGHMIAAAFVATLWGVLTANVMCLPIANRLKRLTETEVAQMELVVEGVVAIQAGANPRVVAAGCAASCRRGRRGRGGDGEEGGVSAGHAPSRTRSGHEEEHENHERWLVSYADMITVLMVLFIVLFAISQVDQPKFLELKSGLADGFGASSAIPVDGGAGRCPARTVTEPGPARGRRGARAGRPRQRRRGQGRRDGTAEAEARLAAAEAELDRLQQIQAALEAALDAEEVSATGSGSASPSAAWSQRSWPTTCSSPAPARRSSPRAARCST